MDGGEGQHSLVCAREAAHAERKWERHSSSSQAPAAGSQWHATPLITNEQPEGRRHVGMHNDEERRERRQ